MNYSAIILRSLVVCTYFCLIAALSCTDHDIPDTPDDPSSACLTTAGTPRTYPCEFRIDKLTFYAKDMSVLGEVVPGTPVIALKRSKAKTDSNPLAMTAGSSGAVAYDVKATVTRIASPSFPVSAGYLLSSTTISAGPMILHTPGERTFIGSPVSIAIPVGTTTEVPFQFTFIYGLSDSGGGVVPFLINGPNTFFLENDVTTLQFNRSIPPYTYVANVVETYIRLAAGIIP